LEELKVKKIPKQAYTTEFKELAIKRAVDLQSIAGAAKELGLRDSIKASAEGKLTGAGSKPEPLAAKYKPNPNKGKQPRAKYPLYLKYPLLLHFRIPVSHFNYCRRVFLGCCLPLLAMLFPRHL
jgi:hypothetical protein